MYISNYNSEKMKSQSNWIYLEKSVFNSFIGITINNRSTCHPRLLQTFYNPFDTITWQTISIFHEEQQVLVSEDEDGGGKKKK